MHSSSPHMTLTLSPMQTLWWHRLGYIPPGSPVCLGHCARLWCWMHLGFCFLHSCYVLNIVGNKLHNCISIHLSSAFIMLRYSFTSPYFISFILIYILPTNLRYVSFFISDFMYSSPSFFSWWVWLKVLSALPVNWISSLFTSLRLYCYLAGLPSTSLLR